MKAIYFLLCMLCTTGAKAGVDFWEYSSFDDTQLAAVKNDAGSVAGVICDVTKNSCLAYIYLGIDCNAGAKVPVMLNAPEGSLQLTARCQMLGGNRFIVFDDFDAAISAFKGGPEIGFAMPLEGGQFKVARFKTFGAATAIEKARKRPTPNKTRSEQTI